MNLFVYGTLLFPEIRKLVGGRDFPSKKATLKEFQIHRIKDATFPGIVNFPGGIVEGEVLFDLSAEEFARFDHYEDGFYLRSTAMAHLESEPGTELNVQIYEIPLETAPVLLSSDPWAKEWFLRHHYEIFLNDLRQNL